MPTQATRLIVLSGPSGVGKGTVLSEVRAQLPDLHITVSATTRQPRPGEQNGRDYHFLTHEQFHTARESGQLAECAEYAGNWYGTLVSELERAPFTVVEADVRGAEAIRQRCPRARTVFLAPPSFAELHARLRKRGTETEEQVCRRLAHAKEEMGHADRYDHVLVCDEVSVTSQQLLELLGI